MNCLQLSQRGIVVLCTAAALLGCTDKDVVAKVGNREINREDLREYRRLTGASGQSDAETLDLVIARERLVLKAKALGLSKKPEVQARLRAAHREVLAQMALAASLEGVTEEKALERYQADKESFAVRSIRVAQIVSMVPPGAKLSEVEAARSRATTAWASLLGGADFAEVARSSSEDGATASKGGELGVIREGEIPQPLFEELMELKEGGFTKPLAGPAGFHIFRALSGPERVVPEFAAIKGKIVAQLRSEAERQLREQLSQEISVKRFPERIRAETGR